MKIISTNKRVSHDYQIIDKFTAGLMLKGYEVKSVKLGYVNITNAWVKVSDGHASIEGMDIPLYRKTSLKQIGNYDPKASRSLLLTKRELAILAQKTNKTGNTIKVIDIFIGIRGYIKMTIGIVKLLRKVDKKNNLKEQDQIREMDKEIKHLHL